MRPNRVQGPGIESSRTSGVIGGVCFARIREGEGLVLPLAWVRSLQAAAVYLVFAAFYALCTPRNSNFRQIIW